MEETTRIQAESSGNACLASRRERPGRPYSPPRLRVFGNVRDVTLSSQTQNRNDPGNGAQLRT